jgi:putative sterol carrier protein
MSTARVTRELFEDLTERRHEPLLARATGILRLELQDGAKTETWTLAVDKGDLTVTHGDDGDADCTLSCERAFFDRLVLGQENAMASALRGDIVLDGSCWRLLVALQKLLPDPSVIALEEERG